MYNYCSVHRQKKKKSLDFTAFRYIFHKHGHEKHILVLLMSKNRHLFTLGWNDAVRFGSQTWRKRRYVNFLLSGSHLMFSTNVGRKRRVGDRPPASQEKHLQAHPHGQQQAPGHHLLPDHQTQTSVLHCQHYHSLCAHLLPGLPRLLPARWQSVHV